MVDTIKELYIKGYSGRDIAKKIGISKTKCLYIIKKLGISRPNIQNRNKYGNFIKCGEVGRVPKKTFNTVYTYRNLITNSSTCSICGEVSELEVHHIDKNRSNNNISNLKILCKPCHRKEHPRERDCFGRFV